MPTYVCYSRAGAITTERQQELASAITEAHSRATGAPASFTQLVFQEVTGAGHFIGGRPSDPRTVWLHGNIRNGRPAAMKDQLMVSLRDLIARVTQVDEDHVWVYLSELEPEQMIEFGRVLPRHGQEDTWMNELPATLRARLEAFETSG